MLRPIKNRLIRFLAIKYLEEFRNFYYYGDSSNVKNKFNLVKEENKLDLKHNYWGDYYQNLVIYKNDYWVILDYMINRKLINNQNEQKIK